MKKIIFGMMLLGMVLVMADNAKAQQRGCSQFENSTEVAVYEHSSFKGRCVRLKTGKYMNAGRLNGVNLDRKISSIIIGKRAKVVMCSEYNFRGNCKTLTKSYNNLGQIGFNDMAVSIRVMLKNDNSPTSQELQNWKVDSAVSFSNGDSYFFSGTQYYKLRRTGGVEAPRAIAGNFASGYPSWDRIDAATRIGSTVYLFRGTQYVRYNTRNGRIDNRPKSIQGNFATNFPRNWSSIDAAVNLGNGNIYFFSGKAYIRYNISKGKIEGSSKPIKGNFATNWVNWNKVDAALNARSGNRVVAFYYGNQVFGYRIKGASITTPRRVKLKKENW